MDMYFIYIHNDNFTPRLYAITESKKLKNSFMNERKKKMFIANKKELSKSEYYELCKKYSGYMLGRKRFETKSLSSIYKQNVVELTSTMNEEMNVYTKGDSVIYEIGKFTEPIARTFNDNILSALDIMHYFEIYKFTNNIYCIYDDFVSGVDSEINNYKIDYLGVFLHFYGYTLDIERIIKNEN